MAFEVDSSFKSALAVVLPKIEFPPALKFPVIATEQGQTRRLQFQAQTLGQKHLLIGSDQRRFGPRPMTHHHQALEGGPHVVQEQAPARQRDAIGVYRDLPEPEVPAELVARIGQAIRSRQERTL